MMDLTTFFGFSKLSPSPLDNFWYGPVTESTSAGVSVDESKAMTYSACWAASMLLSTAESMIPLNLHKELSGGGSEIADYHRVHRLICERPNPEMGAMMYRASRTQQQVNRGNSFSEIERDAGGTPINLWPIHASRIPARNIVRKNGKIVYLVNNNDGSKTPIDAMNMLHVPSPISDDGIVGLGVVEQARLTIGAGIAEEQQAASYFANGARPGYVIEGMNFKTKEDREDFRRQWNDIHSGPGNNGKPALLQTGAKLTTLQFSAEDSQFLESRQFSIEDVARWYGVSPHLIGHLLRATYNNIEHLSMEFVKYSLMRWLVLWEQEINRKLLTENEQKRFYARHDTRELERGDLASRTAALQQEFFNGKTTLNEWRALDDQNPIGPLGDLHFVQSAMVPLEIAAMGPQPAPGAAPPTEPADAADPPSDTVTAPPEEPKGDGLSTTVQIDIDGLRQEFQAKIETLASEKAALQVLVTTSQSAQKQLAVVVLNDAMARMVSLEVNAVKRVAEKASKFDTRLREFYDKHAATMQRALLGPLHAARGDDGPSVQLFVQQHISESIKQLDALLDCQAEELPAKVDECVSKWHEERAMVTI